MKLNQKENNMSRLTIWNDKGESISSVDDWFKYAPPNEREKH